MCSVSFVSFPSLWGQMGEGTSLGYRQGAGPASAREKAGPRTGMSVWHKRRPCRPGVQVPVEGGACQIWRGVQTDNQRGLLKDSALCITTGSLSAAVEVLREIIMSRI